MKSVQGIVQNYVKNDVRAMINNPQLSRRSPLFSNYIPLSLN